MKEVRLRPKTSVHDVDFKSKQIERFVEEGDKVKVTLRSEAGKWFTRT